MVFSTESVMDPTLAIRLKRAWTGLSPDDQAVFLKQLDQANLATTQFFKNGRLPEMEDIHQEMLMARCVLDSNIPMLMQHAELSIKQGQLAIRPYIDSTGVIWGFGKYELFDIRWLESLATLWENFYKKAFDFGDEAPPIIQYPNRSLNLAIVGDWGTGEWGVDPAHCPSQKIADFINRDPPDMTIHLGDVYYSGTRGEEVANLVHPWPRGTWGNFTLNSNHEMYSAGYGYYQKALHDPIFSRQGKRSCFAVEMDDWIILGLDSAYYSSPYGLYMHGALWPKNMEPGRSPQFQLISRVATIGKPIILLTHHNPLKVDGTVDDKSLLFDQVTNAFAGSGILPAYWYYGHVHLGAAYTQSSAPTGKINYRCAGHGGLPWGHAKALDKAGNVAWFEATPVIDSPNNRVVNGFATLRGFEKKVQETFYTEDGDVSWQVTL
jgi:hypothetical protein